MFSFSVILHASLLHLLCAFAFESSASGDDRSQIRFGTVTGGGSGPSVALLSEWHVLGPFQTGTREAPWGADPLESFGGFHSLRFDPHARFKSSIVPNGTVQWSKIIDPPGRNLTTESEVDLRINFPAVDWDFQRAVFGWAALQYQAWVRGRFTLAGDARQTVNLYTDGILEFNVDGVRHFGGDFFAYRRAPLVLHLDAGDHVVELRVLRDVRSMGSVGEPEVNVVVKAAIVDQPLTAATEQTIAADDVDGRLASPFVSIPLTNRDTRPICVERAESNKDAVVDPLSRVPFRLMPGQTRPFAFRVEFNSSRSKRLELHLKYRVEGSESHGLTVSHDFRPKSLHDPHVYTYLHPANVVSYGVIRPPERKSYSKAVDAGSFPLLLALHGSGLEPDNELVKHSLDDVSDIPAWTIFPFGGSSWCGDDWHQWGWGDVQAAIAAIPAWIDQVRWTGPGTRLDQLIVAGHSNGGQGAFYAVTHWPDLVVGVVPVSGFLSVQSYLPYNLWHHSEPAVMAILHSSMNNYRNEMLAPNIFGIPTMQQHGSADDNVPPYHARRMHFLINETGWSSEYHELLGKPHYFNGIMTTDPLRKFYRDQVKRADQSRQPPERFSFIVANPVDFGSKNNVTVAQLVSPGRIGRLDVSVTEKTVEITTKNVRRFRLSGQTYLGKELLVDGQKFSNTYHESDGLFEFLLEDTRTWKGCSHGCPSQALERHGNQLGSLDAVLKSTGTFTITCSDPAAHSIALQISRNLFQYYAADSEIVDAFNPERELKGNVISVDMGSNVTFAMSFDHPIQLDSSGVTIRDRDGSLSRYTPERYDGLGAIFLRPMQDERLELVIWGYDYKGLTMAARLLPTLTGVGQPDFVVVTGECLQRGVDGVTALGFFDSLWRITRDSYLT